MDFLNDNSGAIQGITTVLLVLVTLIYVVLTRSISKSSRESGDAARRTAEATVALASAAEVTTRAAVESSAAVATQARASSAQAEEATRARALSVLPLVIARFDRLGDRHLRFAVVNQGLGPAVSIRVQWIAEKSGGGLLGATPALRPGEEYEGAQPVSSGERHAIAAAVTHGTLTFRCVYMDVLGGEYESGTSSTDLGAIGLNLQGRFTLGDDRRSE